jgi:serine/threonine-protein kinase
MGEVYAASAQGEAGFTKLVALKLMREGFEDPDRLQMFLDEARLAAHITSPYVVSTYDLGRDESGALCIAMELVVGLSLRKLGRELNKRSDEVSFPFAEITAFLIQAAQGLHDAHQARAPTGELLQIVHRDVSPQNILLGIDGRARLTDFGVARAVLRDSQTRSGQLKGKFAYLSPEQAVGAPIDHRSDVFSLGTVAWESLTGERLFSADHPAKIMRKIVAMDVPPVHEARPGVPPEVSAVVERALARPVVDRYQTAAEFAHDLRTAARATLGIPTVDELGQFVDERGGKALQEFRERLRTAATEVASSVGIEALSKEVDAPDKPEATATVGTVITVQQSTPFPRSAPPPSKPKRQRWVVVAVAAVALLVGGALLHASTDSTDGTQSTVPAANPSPATVEEPQAEPRPSRAQVAESPEPAEATSPRTDAGVEPAVMKANPRTRVRRARTTMARPQTAPPETTREPAAPVKTRTPNTTLRPVTVEDFDRELGL